jgi:NAD(P)-dependent dehydrogenase (short-subunit alcohol dehydrogenase family)
MAERDSIEQKVFLVTGATSGIGRATALALAEMGARVIVHGRSREKAVDTATGVQNESGNPAVDTLLADYASLAQVRQMAGAFREKYGRLDALVNNAGAMFISREETADGFERTFQINHLAPFLLTNLLLPTLQQTAQAQGEARVVTVSSDAHKGRRLDFDDLQKQQGFQGMDMYGQSKLANLYFAYELARRVAGTGITSNALHPGFVASNIGANNIPFGGSLIRGLINLFTPRNAEEGAETGVYLATSPAVSGVTGEYFVDCQPVSSSPASRDESAARRLWERSAEMVGLQT